jgi:hypothetical protein
MAWLTRSGWKRSWGTRAFRKKAARVASRRTDKEETQYDVREDPWAPTRALPDDDGEEQ